MVSVTRNFQITIPKLVRNILGINLGDEIMFERRTDGFNIKKAETVQLADFIGVLDSKSNLRATELQRKWRAEFKKREKKLGI